MGYYVTCIVFRVKRGDNLVLGIGHTMSYPLGHRMSYPLYLLLARIVPSQCKQESCQAAAAK